MNLLLNETSLIVPIAYTRGRRLAGYTLKPHICLSVFLSILLTHTSVFAGACNPGLKASTANELKFSDFFKMPVGATGLEATEQLNLANGTRVCIAGYMVKMESPSPGQILLTPVPVVMSEHADGEADDLPVTTVSVLLTSDQQTWVVPHVTRQVAVTGTLRVGRREVGEGRISWIQLELTDPLPNATSQETQ